MAERKGSYFGFHSPTMGTDMTLDCGAKYAADLENPAVRIADGKKPGKGPDSLLADIATGRIASRIYSAEEALALLQTHENEDIS